MVIRHIQDVICSSQVKKIWLNTFTLRFYKLFIKLTNTCNQRLGFGVVGYGAKT